MDRLNEGSWGNDPVGHGRLAAVVMDGILTVWARRLFGYTSTALFPHWMHWIILGNKVVCMKNILENLDFIALLT